MKFSKIVILRSLKPSRFFIHISDVNSRLLFGKKFAMSYSEKLMLNFWKLT